MAQDFLDFRQEAHVQHAVGFIQHQEFQLIELGVRLAEVVQQASGRGDQHIGAAAERVLLRSHADAAEDGGRGQGGVNGDIAEALIDLRRQLAGGRQHERARCAARLGHQMVQDGEQKRVRLAAAGHGAGQEVPAFESGRDGVGLNRRRTREPQLLKTTLQVGVQREAGEGRRRAQGLFHSHR